MASMKKTGYQTLEQTIPQIVKPTQKIKDTKYILFDWKIQL